jgi:hypothetical protein
MKSVLLVEDDIIFARAVKRELTEFNIISFDTRDEFFNFNLIFEEINKASYFLIDFHLGGEINILNSGIYEKILEFKNEKAKIISISSDKDALKDRCHLYAGKNVDFIKFILT